MDAEGLVAMVTKLSVALRTFQRTSMSTYTRVAVAQTKQLQDIITAGNFSLLELAPVMVAIEESGFPEESKKTLQACIGDASVIGKVDAAKGFQNWETVCSLLPESVWAGDFASQLMEFMVSAGLRSPTEGTFRTLSSHILLFTDGPEKAMAMSRESRDMSIEMVKQWFRRIVKDNAPSNPYTFVRRREPSEQSPFIIYEF